MAVLETIQVPVSAASGCNGINTCAIQRLDDATFTYVHPVTGVVTPVATLANLFILFQNILSGLPPRTILPL